MTEQSALPRKFIICIIALVTLHAFLMNGYYFTHKRLTIGTYLDPIVAQTDPTLFNKSIYVQAVKRTNVRLSISHDINLFIIRHFDFEKFALLQEITSLFFSLAGIFALTRALFASSGAGLIAMLLYTAELNNWTLGSPAPYLNFFHHGLLYAYPLILWSMVFFFQKRYPVSLLLAGLAWNFHPMCTVFVLWAYCLFWAFNYKDKELKASTVGYCILCFTLPALPAIIRSFSYLGSTQQLEFSGLVHGSAVDRLVYLFSLNLAGGLLCPCPALLCPVYARRLPHSGWFTQAKPAYFHLLSAYTLFGRNRVRGYLPGPLYHQDELMAQHPNLYVYCAAMYCLYAAGAF